MKNYRLKIALLFILIPLTFIISFAQVPSIGGMMKPGIVDEGGVTPVTCDWDMTSLVYANNYGSVGAECALPMGSAFSLDGTIMIVAEFSGNVYRYDLSTPFDPSTRTYNGNYFTVTQGSSLYDIDFNDEGTIMFICTSSNSTIFQYDLSTAWDLNTVSYSGKSFYRSGTLKFCISRDGTHLLRSYSQSSISEHSIGTAWDISTINPSASSSQSVSGLTGLYVSRDGNYLVYTTTTTIREYSLLSQYSLANWSSVKNLTVSGQDGGMWDVTIPNKCGVVFTNGINNDRIYEYSY